MKTLICQEPGKLELIQSERPSEPTATEVLLSIKRIGICGTDLHAFTGKQPYFTYPRILGHELSAEVIQVGEDVTNVRKGDRVTVIPYLHCGSCIACRGGKNNCCTDLKVIGVHQDGGMQEQLKVQAKYVILTNELSWEEAAIVEPLSIGAHAVNRAEIQAGETALVIGAGPIGLGVARFAKLQGAKVIVMDVSQDRLDMCQQWTKCDEAVLASERPLDQILQRNIQELPSIVFDATGSPASMMRAFDYVAHGGKLIYVGLVKEQISFSNPEFHKRELTLMGSRNATQEDFQFVIQYLSEKKVDASAYLSQTIPFDQVTERFAVLEANRHLIKTLITLEEAK
jgi:2-desacetyl-2-hydroxyethyl bacteriochlorophyllide A dehydrogenase